MWCARATMLVAKSVTLMLRACEPYYANSDASLVTCCGGHVTSGGTFSALLKHAEREREERLICRPAYTSSCTLLACIQPITVTVTDNMHHDAARCIAALCALLAMLATSPCGHWLVGDDA